MSNEFPTGGEVTNALKRSWGEATEGAAIETPKGAAIKCTNKFACRCDGCKSLYNLVRKSTRQPVTVLHANKKNDRPKGSIYKGLSAPVTPPKQPKSSPGQMSLLDVMGE
jgi:hypothetical protein